MNFQKIYEYRLKGTSPGKKVAVWRHIARHIESFMPNAEKILDPCAGSCEFINQVNAREAWAVDQEGDFIKSAKPNVKAILGDIFEVPLPENYFGGVFVSNFLEHLDSPETAAKFLAVMRKTLAPGGRIVLMGPNFKYCAEGYFDCCDHQLVLTHRSLEELLYSEGFEIIKTFPKYLPYSFRGRLSSWPPLAGLYLKFPLAWRFLGKQFLVIAEKREGFS